jgi:hypothetical protein
MKVNAIGNNGGSIGENFFMAFIESKLFLKN